MMHSHAHVERRVRWRVVTAAGAVLALASCGRATVSLPSASTVIPAPVSVESSQAPAFVLTPETKIVVPAGDERVAGIGQWLASLIGTSVAEVPLAVQTEGGSPPAGSISLAIRPTPATGDEGYELTAADGRVTIAAAHPAGLFYGVQTLRALLPPFVEYRAVRPDASRRVTVPAVRIVDRPRFAWRGAMLDVARHFFDVNDVKRYIDLMAMCKMNRLHLHLADDQGWRIDIASWPDLARHGSATQVGGGPGGYYTQQQYSDLVAYAQARFITVVPEVDMPGHTNAALASYPELNCDGAARPLYTGIDVGFSALCVDKEVTYRFIDDVVREIAALTPGAYFHVGGDEVKTLAPAKYAQFIERVQGIVQSHGKQMIGWDEIAPTRLLPTSIVQHWRPETTPIEAVAKGAKIVLSPANKVYLDMKYGPETVLGQNWAGNIRVRDSYEWDPATFLAGVPESAILGVEAPIWSETLANIRDVEYLAFPRLAAVAEIGWSPADRRRWTEFSRRLGAQSPRWSALGLNFYRSPDVPWR